MTKIGIKIILQNYNIIISTVQIHRCFVQLCMNSTDNGSHIGVLYGLPKAHKRDVPTRPICSVIGTSTYELGKFLSQIIKPAATCSLGTDLDNTFSFVEQISKQNLSNMVMVSFDVRSLFTNIPLRKTIRICLDRLYRGDPAIRPYIPEKTLEGLLKLCVCDNTFVFNGKIYQQTDGVAMGSSLGPLLANIYMAHLEEEFMLKNNHIFSPTFYRIYHLFKYWTRVAMNSSFAMLKVYI